MAMTKREFYEILMNQPEEEAKDIALSLELFVNGSLNILIIKRTLTLITVSPFTVSVTWVRSLVPSQCLL